MLPYKSDAFSYCLSDDFSGACYRVLKVGTGNPIPRQNCFSTKQLASVCDNYILELLLQTSSHNASSLKEIKLVHTGARKGTFVSKYFFNCFVPRSLLVSEGKKLALQGEMEIRLFVSTRVHSRRQSFRRVFAQLISTLWEAGVSHFYICLISMENPACCLKYGADHVGKNTAITMHKTNTLTHLSK